uniref:Small nuclear ribonucleoprotein Sm D3 n=1 Tax=Lygus hesperus TaxID=30085 RepID=A0A0A9YL00_LYGHE
MINSSLRAIAAPVKLLHECVGCTCTVEMQNGDVYRGLVIDVEDCWNIQINECIYTSRTGQSTKLAHVYLRGSQVRYVIAPDMLKNSPIFKHVTPKDRAKTADEINRITMQRHPNKRNRVK